MYELQFPALNTIQRTSIDQPNQPFEFRFSKAHHIAQHEKYSKFVGDQGVDGTTWPGEGEEMLMEQVVDLTFVQHNMVIE